MLLSWFATRNLELTKIWAYGDLIGFPDDLRITSNLAFFAWDQEGMGFASFKPFNYYLTALATSTLLGSNVAQKALFLCAIPLSFVSSLFLMKRLCLKIAPAALGALVYALNPLTMSEMIGGSITLIVYSVFPIAFWFIFKILWFEEYSKGDLVILGLTSFLIFNLHAAFWYVLLLVPFFLVTIIHRTTKPMRLVRFLVPLAIAGLVLAPNIVGYIGINGNNVGNLDVEADALYCYSDATVFNFIRLAGNKGSAQAEEFLDYNSLNLRNVFGYSLILVGAFAFFLKIDNDKKSPRRIMIHTLLLTFVVLVVTMLFIRSFPFITNLNSILSSLRNPGKLMYPMALAVSLLFGYGIDALFIKLGALKKSKLIPVACLALIACVLIYDSPSLDGSLGIEKIRGQDYYVEDKYASLPSLLDSIDSSYSDYRVLFMPWEDSTLLKVGSGVPNYFGMPLGGGVTTDTKWLGEVLEVATAQDSPDRSSTLGLFGVKYIVIDKKFGNFNSIEAKDNTLCRVYESYDSYWISGNPEYFYALYNTDDNFEIKFENQDFAIFENKRALSIVYSRINNVDITIENSLNSENLLDNNMETCVLKKQAWPVDLIEVIDENTVCLLGQNQWWTHLYQRVAVEENRQYSLRFSVKACNATDLHVKIMWFNNSQNETESSYLSADYIKLYKYENISDEWLAVDETFFVPKGVKSAWIWFGASRLENYTSTRSYYTNITFQEASTKIKNKLEVFTGIEELSFSRINPTKYSGKFNAYSSSILVFSESFNPSWVCYVDNQRIEPICLYGAVNGYMINKTGAISVTLEYQPQSIYYIACGLSISTTLLASVWLAFTFFRNRFFSKKKK